MQFDKNKKLIEVNVNGIFLTQTQASGIILKERYGERSLPIVIGDYEAQSIALALEDLPPPRPITHDLAVKMLETLSVQMDKVVITELRENTYYAIIYLTKNGESFEIDARPSDAIAMAVRMSTTIFVNEKVMEQAGYIPDEKEESGKSYLFKSKADELERLKKDLQKAVEAEEYEKAAQLRDRIQKLESKS